MSSLPTTDSGRAYHRTCSGEALKTVNAHSSPQDITMFGSCFCPFVQRVWTALEYLDIPYYYYEVDPYKKSQDLLAVSPKGLVPALKLDTFNPPRAIHESTVILEYLDELAQDMGKAKSLYPSKKDLYSRAQLRILSDTVNRALLPAMYRYLTLQDPAVQATASKEFTECLTKLGDMFEKAESEGCIGLGLWSGEQELSIVDVMVAPWIFRATNALAHYRGYVLPFASIPGTIGDPKEHKLSAWIHRLLSHPAFKATCSEEQLYIDSYERYAFNRPKTSMVAEAVNAGRNLP